MFTSVRAARCRRRAFTMIEVLVVLGIMGFLMATIYGTLYSTLKISRDISMRVSGSKVGPILLDQIEHDLRSLFVYNVDGKHLLRGESQRIGGMDADKIAFVAQVASTSSKGYEDQKSVFANVNEIGYGLSQNPENSDFLVLWRGEDFFVDDEPLKGVKGTWLYRRVTGFNVNYYRELGEDADKVEDWDPEKEKSLPAAIEIALTIEIDPNTVAGFSGGDAERQTHTFSRWIVFNQSMPLTLAVRPKIPELGASGDDAGDGTGGKGPKNKDDDTNAGGGAGKGPGGKSNGIGKNPFGKGGQKGKGGKGGASGGLGDIFGGGAKK